MHAGECVGSLGPKCGHVIFFQNSLNPYVSGMKLGYWHMYLETNLVISVLNALHVSYPVLLIWHPFTHTQIAQGLGAISTG